MQAILDHFDATIPNCLKYASKARADGRPIVGILCEFTPREIILAAGAVPVCLCGGSAAKAAAAEGDLPANLCPLIKSTYGYHLTRSNPFLEMADLVVAETTCDGKKKMYELMGESRPMFVLELPQQPDGAEARPRWLAELRRLKSELESRFGVAITDARLRDAIGRMNRERRLRRSLAALMAADSPPLTGLELLSLKSSISCIPADIEQYERALGILGEGRAPGVAGDAVRVLLTGVPMVYGAERAMEIVEGRGGVVVAYESCTGIKPVDEDVDAEGPDPLDAIAGKYLHLPCPVMMPNRRRFDLLGRLVETFRPECVIELVWQACLTYDVETFSIRRFCAETLNLPYLKIETDYSPSDSERIAVRVEALYETVRRRPGRDAPR